MSESFGRGYVEEVAGQAHKNDFLICAMLTAFANHQKVTLKCLQKLQVAA